MGSNPTPCLNVSRLINPDATYGGTFNRFTTMKKIAFAAAHTFAMEAATMQCAAFIDRGFEDYMLETAILKVFATEHLWTIVNDTIQVWGGKAYFCDQPLERWMRDARINTIGEGANDVLKAFVAVVGCRGPGEYLKNLRDDMKGGRWSLRKIGEAAGLSHEQIRRILARRHVS